ncbi:MAG: RNA polymerase sigma factor [Pseudomonadota bacterium]
MRIRGLLRSAVGQIVPSKDIDDIVQEAYVRACQAGTKDAKHSPRAFLFTIARNLALDYTRKAETRLVTPSSDVIEDVLANAGSITDDTLNRVITNEEFGEFCRVVRELPPKQRRVFVMKKVYGFSQREIATEMGISEKTVERHITLATKNCFERLAHDFLPGSDASPVESTEVTQLVSKRQRP